MTLILGDGFDMYSSITGLETGAYSRGWTTASLASFNTGSALQVGYGRFGGQSVGMSTVNPWTMGMYYALPTTVTTPITVGFAMYVDTWNVTNGNNGYWGILGFTNANAVNSQQFHITMLSDRTLAIQSRDAAYAATSSSSIPMSKWVYIEVEIVTLLTGSCVVNVWVDGAIFVTGTVTNYVGNTSINGVVLACDIATGSNLVFYDDFYVGTSPEGPQRIQTLAPNAAGASTQWNPSPSGPNYARVNGLLLGDASYVGESTSGDQDLYDLDPMTAMSTTSLMQYSPVDGSAMSPIVYDPLLVGAQVAAFAKKTDSSSRSLDLTMRSGATTSQGSSVSLTTSYVGYNRMALTDPATGAAWTESGINALQVGPHIP